MPTRHELTAEEHSILAYVETLLQKRRMRSALALLRDERTKLQDLRAVIDSFRRAVSTETPMRQKPKRRTFITEEHGVIHVLHDIRDHHLKGVEAWDYMDRYIKLKAKEMQLQKNGTKARIVLPDYPRRPLLVIER